jgi:hypothetical protein
MKGLKSRTVKFNLLMGALQSLNGSLAMWQAHLDPLMYVQIATGLALLQSVGGIYLRYLTTTSIDQK